MNFYIRENKIDFNAKRYQFHYSFFDISSIVYFIIRFNVEYKFRNRSNFNIHYQNSKGH